MTVETIRFGAVEIDDGEVITLDGLLGLEEYREFALLNVEESFPVLWLQCVTDGGVALPVIDTFSVEPEYAFDIGDADAAEIGLSEPGDARILSILGIPEQIERMTINLAAPIVVNTRTRRAKQIVLTNPDYGVRMPVFFKVCRLMRSVEDGEAEGTESDVTGGEAIAGAVAED